jgi:ABC-type spermidine/putrescine transport system permease subunit II
MLERMDCRSDNWMEGVAVTAAAGLECCGAPGVSVTAAIAAALLAGVLGVTADVALVRAATAGEAGVSTEAALRVRAVPAHGR